MIKRNCKMKKLILILSYVLGSISLLVLVGILLYYTVWLQSFDNMKADDDHDTYQTIYTNYSNGTLTVKNPQNDTIEIITPDEKKIVAIPQSPYVNTPMLFDNHFIIVEDNVISLYDTEYNKTDEIKLDGEFKGLMYGKEHMLYYAVSDKVYGYNIQLKTSDVVFLLDSGELYNIAMIKDLLYISYMLGENTYKLVEYNPTERKINAEYRLNDLNLNNFNVSGVFKDYVYLYNSNDNLSKQIYEYNLSSQELEFICEFSYDAQINNEFVYYVGKSTDFETSENNSEKYGLWRLNLETKTTQFISNKVDDDSFYLCTDNFVYSYKFSYIFEDGSGSSPFHRIYRGYTVDQIPVQLGQ